MGAGIAKVERHRGMMTTIEARDEEQAHVDASFIAQSREFSEELLGEVRRLIALNALLARPVSTGG